MKCSNCGGEHTAAYGGCAVSKEAVEVQKIKAVQHITFAEALKNVRAVQHVPAMQAQNNPLPRVQAIPVVRERGETGVGGKAKECKECKQITKDTLLIKKDDFLMFIIHSINCAAQTSSKTEKAKIIVTAAEKYLSITGVSVDKILERLTGGPCTST